MPGFFDKNARMLASMKNRQRTSKMAPRYVAVCAVVESVAKTQRAARLSEHAGSEASEQEKAEQQIREVDR